MKLEQTQARIRWLTLAILVGSAVLLTILDSTGSLDSVLAFARDPLTGITAWTNAQTDTVTNVVSGPRNIAAARTQLADLQARVDELERENEQLREIQREYQLLQELFNSARETPEYTRITANVIGQDTNPAIRSIIIDRGRNDGVRVGMPVEAARGLVGQVYRVSDNAAQVALLTETASAIPVRLGTTRATGVLRGSGRGQSPAIDWIDLKYEVEVGEEVLSSGLGGKFPENLVVGRVLDVERNEAELFQRALVQPAVNFDTLEMVFVITDFDPVETEIFEQAPNTP